MILLFAVHRTQLQDMQGNDLKSHKNDARNNKTQPDDSAHVKYNNKLRDTPGKNAEKTKRTKGTEHCCCKHTHNIY